MITLVVLMANWPAVALAVVAVLALGWLLLRRRRPKLRERHRAPDALDEGAAPANRNQALIDAPHPAAEFAVGAAGGAPDDLLRIKGLGPKLAARLGELGVTRLDQIASWDEAEMARIDAQLGAFAGRPARDGWVEQARFLSAGDVKGYEAKFGKL